MSVILENEIKGMLSRNLSYTTVNETSNIALQAPACHENMLKMGGYILGEFGNLTAGDQRSSLTVQFQLLHSKYHLCSPMTRALLISTYVKFINLFPEIRSQVEEVFKQHSNLRSADAELQQRASEYLQLSIIASSDVLATLLEEMPAFPERESSILAVLKKKKPGRLPENEIKETRSPVVTNNHTNNEPQTISSTSSADLLGLSTPTQPSSSSNTGGGLLDVLGDVYGNKPSAPLTSTIQPNTSNFKKFV
ncbi:hypothetical protein WA026_008793 [Henosepilachna vigintioctopunctata]|uniref:Clathrin/coatomer adaptor adaptin-like N-terminal domain-containing protein n=1 Tax=Henosepilachna vigintioctopunctata TaxID=420089 RepID=A0AAW1VCF1_9CUCU